MATPRKDPAARTRSQESAAERIRPAANPTREQAQRAHDDPAETIDFDAANLKAPPARPGYDQRWIRSSVFGKDDVINVQRQAAKGWKPRQMGTIKDSFRTPSEQHGRFAGCLVVEGMVLCERPKEITKKHKAHIRGKIDKQTEAIDAELRNASTRNPAYGPITKQHKSVPVRERPVQVAEDEGLDQNDTEFEQARE